MFQQKSFFNQSVILLFSVLCFYSCAQPKKLVTNVYAYYTERMPGNIQADENGNARPIKPDTVIVVYIETTTQSISWDTAWKNNRAYKIVPQRFDSSSYEAGFKKGTTEKVFISVDPKNFLYQLYLQPVDRLQASPKEMDANEILLKAKYKGKIFFRKTGKIIELDTYPSV